jgi:two-component system, NtrC family, response regulator AtoC
MTRAVAVLVVSNDAGVCTRIKQFLEPEGHVAYCVSSPGEAIEALSNGASPDFLFLDVARNGRIDHLFAPSLLEQINSHRVCILTELGDTSWKSHALKWSINTILIKPVLRSDLERLIFDLIPLESELSTSCSTTKTQLPSVHLEELGNNRFFLAASSTMLQIYRDIRLLSPVDVPVLILGESGVGKEIVAMLLHKYHVRSEKKFVNVNCAALPTELLESELFGYEVGAFTGAVKAKPGKFELADKGTILLDEIGEMSPQMQAKLLHVLQDGSFSRLGARSSTRVDVRVLAATNINMENAIAEKRFREDLYYRLNAFTITVPPLRERREEIPLLMEELARRGAAELGQEVFPVSERLKEVAQDYYWPGNLRELRNFITRALVLQNPESAYRDLEAKIRATPTNLTANTYMSTSNEMEAKGMRSVVNGIKNQTEIRMIQNALSASGWNRRKAASDLNISYRALLYKIQQHGLTT